MSTHCVWRLCLIFAFAGPALGESFSLIRPVDCELGENQQCYIQYLPDRDPTSDSQDFACGHLTYDTHKGTDFALRSRADLQRGVKVVAAASGTVRGTRDGMIDQIMTEENQTYIDGRDCGNGVVLTHPGGWETQYCHLKRGSITVRTGQTVEAGQTLGEVGLSGRTQFPHLHLSVRFDGAPVDPNGNRGAAQCGLSDPQDSLWQNPPVYQPGGLISAGFSPGIPDFAEIKGGTAHHPELPEISPALVIWGYVFGAKAGDILKLTIQGPRGDIVHETEITLEKSQPQLFRATGRRTQNTAWFQTGTYRGRVEMLRKGKLISRIETFSEVRP